MVRQCLTDGDAATVACRNLIDQMNRAALERVAQVSESNGVYKIALRPVRALNELNYLYCTSSPSKAQEYRWRDRKLTAPTRLRAGEASFQFPRRASPRCEFSAAQIPRAKHYGLR